MSHTHESHPGYQGCCIVCGCGDGMTYLGCNTMLEDDSFISCRNKEARMSPENPPPGSTIDSESPYTLAGRIGSQESSEYADGDPAPGLSGTFENVTDHPIVADGDVQTGGDSTHHSAGHATQVRREDIPHHFEAEVEGGFMEQDTSRYESPDYDEKEFAKTDHEGCTCGEVPFDHMHCDELRPDDEWRGDDPNTAMHFSGGKPPMHQLPREGLRAVADVFAYGEIKYDRHNWKKGMPWSELLNSGLRHVFDFIDGEDFDPESAQLHLAHAAWNFLVLIDYYRNHPEYDDRYQYPVEEVDDGQKYDMMGNPIEKTFTIEELAEQVRIILREGGA